MASDNTDLIRAVWEDKVEEVTALLEQGLDINSKSDEGDNLLNVAATKGNIPMVLCLLEKGVNIDNQDSEGWYPIHTAARHGSMDMLEILLKYGSNVNAENENHTTPLCLAVRYGSPEMVSLLLEAGAKVGASSTNNWTPLHLAARFSSTEVVQMMIENGADIHSKTEEGWSAIHFAAQYNTLETVKYLADNGADVTVKGANNATALHLASLEGSPDMVDLLLSLGAGIDAQDDNKYNALMHSVFQSNVEKVKLFLKRKCQLHVTNNQSWNVLHIAANYGSPEIAKLLLDSGASQFMDDLDSKGNTALHHAIESGSIDMVNLFCEYVDDINGKSSLGWTNLHHVACYGDSEKLQAILKKGADINSRPIDHASTPLHVAAIYGSPEMITIMLDIGADVNAVDLEGFAPIHSATRFGQPQTVWLMLEQGASAIVTTSANWTPLHLAVGNGDIDMARMLCEKGADINAQKNDGKTALHLAIKDCTAIMTHLLIALGANTDIADNDGHLPLHLALLYGTNEVVDAILEQNVELNIKTGDGKSPLQIAIQSKNLGNIQRMASAQDAAAILESLEFAMLENCNTDILNLLDEAYLQADKRTTWDNQDLLALYRKVTTISCDGEPQKNADDFDQTVLHHAAKFGIKSQVLLFLQHGWDINQKDFCGTTPLQLITSNPALLCQVAEQLGNDQKYDEDFHEFTKWFQSAPSTDQIINEVLPIELAETWQPDGVSGLPVPEKVAKWLSTNEINSDEAQQEFQVVLEGVDGIVKMILRLMAETDQRMACRPFLTGSLSEGTKCGYPDQFDYLCQMENFSQNFELPKDVKVGLDLKSKDSEVLSEFTDDDNNLSVTKMVSAFNTALSNVLLDGLKLKDNLPQCFIVEQSKQNTMKMPQIKLVWHGKVFKWLKIIVDLQPAIEISVPEDKIRDLPINIQTGLYHGVPTASADGRYSNNFQLSFAATESVLFRVLQEDIRFGYILAKTFLTSKVCPSIDIHVLDKVTKPQDYIFTYLLKTCLLYELVEAKMEGEPIEMDEESEPGTIPERILVWADRIYARLEYFLEQGFLPSYYTPEYDLLFGQIVVQGNEIASKLRNDNKISQARHIMYAYCDLIRNKIINA